MNNNNDNEEYRDAWNMDVLKFNSEIAQFNDKLKRHPLTTTNSNSNNNSHTYVNPISTSQFNPFKEIPSSSYNNSNSNNGVSSHGYSHNLTYSKYNFESSLPTATSISVSNNHRSNRHRHFNSIKADDLSTIFANVDASKTLCENHMDWLSKLRIDL